MSPNESLQDVKGGAHDRRKGLIKTNDHYSKVEKNAGDRGQRTFRLH